MTSSPTLSPTVLPSHVPFTTIPSAHPTITGSVTSLTLSGITSDSMSVHEIDEITSDIAGVYGVTEADVVLTVDYISSGALNATIPSAMSHSEAVDSIEKSISDILGIHSSNVNVLIDDEGKITYSVAVDSYITAASMVNTTQQGTFVSQLYDALQNFGIDLEDVAPEDDVDILVSFRFHLLIF